MTPRTATLQWHRTERVTAQALARAGNAETGSRQGFSTMQRNIAVKKSLISTVVLWDYKLARREEPEFDDR